MDILTAPSFPDDEWEAVRAELLASLDAQLDRPRDVALDALSSTVFAGTAYGHSIADTRAGTSRLTPKDLEKFWRSRYRAGSLAVAYSGEAPVTEVADALAGLRAIRGSAPAREALRVSGPQGVVRVARPMTGKEQANLYLAWAAPPLDSDDWILWGLAEKAIGGDLAGRLWKLRQEEGLAYSVWLSGMARRDHPLTYVYMATAGQKREKALEAIEREIRRATEGLTADELRRVKVSYLASLSRMDRTAERRTERMAGWWSEGLGVGRRQRLERVIDGATLADVNRVVAGVLDPGKYTFAEAGAVPE